MSFDDEIRSALREARGMSPSDAEIAGLLERLESAPKRRVRRAPAVLVGSLVAVLLAGSAVAMPPVRAALGDLGDFFSGYFEDQQSADAPGRALQPSDTPPRWLTAGDRKGQRLLAEAGGYELYVVEEPSGSFGFALGDTVGLSDSARGWERQFEENSVVVLGPGGRADEAGIVPIYGVNTPEVDSLEVRYERGEPTAAAPTRGGFVALADAARMPTELAAFDEDAEPIQIVDLTYMTWRQLAKPAP